MKIILISMLLLCSTGPLSAQNWQEVVQRDTIHMFAKTEKNGTDGTMLVALSQPIVSDGVKIDMMTFTYTFNCAQPHQLVLKEFKAHTAAGEIVQDAKDEMNVKKSAEFDRLRWDVFCNNTLKDATHQTGSELDILRNVRALPTINSHTVEQEFVLISASPFLMHAAVWNASSAGAVLKWVTLRSQTEDLYTVETFTVNCADQTVTPQLREDFFVFSLHRAGMIKTAGFSDRKRFMLAPEHEKNILLWCNNKPQGLRTSPVYLINAYHKTLGSKGSVFTSNYENALVVKEVDKLLKFSSTLED